MSTNPYQPIEDAQTGIVEYAFKGVVSEKDIGRGMKFTAAFMGCFGAFLINEGVGSFRFESPTSGTILFGLGGASIFMTARLWFWARRMVKANHFLTGPVRGSISSAHVHAESHGMSSRMSSACVQIESVTPNGIGLVTTTYRFLPKHLFADYEGAKQLATEIKRQSSIMVPGDERLRIEFPEQPHHVGPEHSVRLSGKVLSSDFQTQDIRNGLRRLRFTIAFLCAIVVTVGLVTYQVTDEPVAAIVVGGIFGFWAYRRRIRLLLMSLRSFREQPEGDGNVMFFLRGWLDATGVSMWSANGNSRYEWSAFQAFTRGDEDTVVCQLLPRALYVGIHRRMVSSDDDWNKAIEFITSAVPDSEVTS